MNQIGYGNKGKSNQMVSENWPLGVLVFFTERRGMARFGVLGGEMSSLFLPVSIKKLSL